MRRTAALTVGCAVALGAVGCGEDREGQVVVKGSSTGTTATAPATRGTGVPAGVAAQYRKIEEEVAAEGGERTVGLWRIAYIVEPAEGWFEPQRGRLRWRAPAAGETNHIEILPIEAKTGRVVPDVPITLEVVDDGGRRVARRQLAFYYSEFFHYASNFALPRSGRYTLRSTVGVPAFRRHGEQADGPPLAQGARVEFRGVQIEAGG
jgi:hypothetical protein